MSLPSSREKNWENKENKQKNHLENEQLLLDLSDNWGHGANCCPQDWNNPQRYRESQLTGNRSPRLEPISMGTLSTVFERLLEAQCGWVWELNILRRPSLGKSPHFPEVLPENYREISSCSHQGKGKGTILKYTQSSLFSWTSLPQGKLFFQSLTLGK